MKTLALLCKDAVSVTTRLCLAVCCVTAAFGEDTVGFSLEVVPIQSFNPEAASKPVPSILETETGLPLDVADFDVVYLNNDTVGIATMSVTGKPGSKYAEQTVSTTFPIAKRCYVKMTVETEGDGESWDSAMSLSNALAQAADSATPCEFWLAATDPIPYPYSVTLQAPLLIRGGFAGDEDSLADRAANAITTFDGDNTVVCLLTVDNAEGAVLELERVKICRAKKNGLVKTGKGGLSLYSCEISGNGLGAEKTYGRGMNVKGGGVGSLVVSNCTYAGNRYSATGGVYGGLGIYAESFKSATIDNSLFVTNGYTLLGAPDSKSWIGYFTRGSAINMIDTPTAIRNSRFAGNCCPVRSSDVDGQWDGGAVFLQGRCGGSFVDHCQFIGNTDRLSFQPVGVRYSGALSIYLKTKTDRATVRNCTFAYNITQGDFSAGGLTVGQGDVDVLNSIFWRNERAILTTVGYGRDIQVHANGTVHLADSFVTALDGTAVAGTGVDIDDGSVYAADPKLVTSTADFESLVTSTASYFYYTETRLSAKSAMDCHLLSSAGYRLNDGREGPATQECSPAIDSGNPYSDYSREPSPNGGCINLGAFGNTPEASKTSVGQPCAAIEMTFPDGMARPKATVTMGLAEGSDYSAHVTLTCSTGGVPLAVREYDGVASTDVIDSLFPIYVPVGVEVTAMVAIIAKGATNVAYAVTKPATGILPAYFGKGGGSNVIHVRQGADCRMDGSNWTDAYPDLASVFKNAPDETKTEVWLSVTNDCLPTPVTLSHPLSFRGGFSGVENSSAERRKGVCSTIDGRLLYRTLGFVVEAGSTASVERILFTRSNVPALSKTGAGDLNVVDCRFVDNQGSGQIDGRGLYASGGKVSVADCQFIMNRGGTSKAGFGCGINLTDCENAYVDNCLFATNGGSFGTSGRVWSGLYNGSAVYVKNTPAVLRNCRFVAHGAGQRDDTDGGIVYFCGTSGGSALTNCAIIGNSDFLSLQNNTTGKAGGALVCALSSQDATLDVCNCTIAYNLTQGQYSSAGLNVISGTVNVRNSIIFGNIRGCRASSDAGADVDVKVGATANLYYTLLTAKGEPSVKSVGTLNIAPTCFAGNPSFVSTTNDFQTLLTGDADWWNLPQGNEGACAALNVHLRGGSGYVDEITGALVAAYARDKDSLAMDAGDPKSDYSHEARPNGQRINLGAYGNTPYATMSNYGLMLIVR